MHLPSLPTTLLILAVSLSTSATPLPGMHCGENAISFLSPRYQTVLGLRRYCSGVAKRGGEYALKRRSFLSVPRQPLVAEALVEEGELYGKRDIPVPSTDEDLAPLVHLLTEEDCDGISLTPTSYKTASQRLADIGEYTWLDFQRKTHSVASTLASIDTKLSGILANLNDHVIIAGAVAFLCVLLVLLSAEMVVKKRLDRAHSQKRMLRRILRRGIRVKVQETPFVLDTINEEMEKQIDLESLASTNEEKDDASAQLWSSYR